MSLRKVDGPDDLMTAADAARILGLSSDMVRLIARGGTLPFLSTVGGVRLFRRADVVALARARDAKRRSAKGVTGRKPRGAQANPVVRVARAK